MSESLAQMRGETQMLFHQAELSDWLASFQRDCKAEVASAGEDTLLGADADAWADQLAAAFAVEPLVVRREEMDRAAPFHVATLLDPDGTHRPRHPVHSTFSVEPGGTPLGKVATEEGLWE